MGNFQCKLVRLNDLCDAGKSSLALTSFLKGLALIFQFEKKQKDKCIYHVCVIKSTINNEVKKSPHKILDYHVWKKKLPDKIVYYDVWCPEEVENI